MPPRPTPTDSGIPQRLGDFATLPEALDYAARGASGLNIYSGRGDLTDAVPYGALRDRAARLARQLLGAGLARGDRVAIVATADADFAATFLACQLAGLIPAPLPLPLAFGGREIYADHAGRLASASRASALIAPPALMDWLAPLRDALALRLCATAAELDALPEPAADLRPAGADEVCYLQFSSGSTRFPLGVAVTQRALMANLTGIHCHGLRVRPGDRCASWLPLYHDMGLVGFFLAPIGSQMSVDWLPTADFARRPLEWLRLMSANRSTFAFSPSFGYELCVRRLRGGPPPEGLDLSSWRVAGIGGDMIRPHHLDAFSDAFAPAGFRRDSFVPSYGMAEATLALSFAPLDRGMRTDRADLDRLERDGVAAAPAATARAPGPVPPGSPPTGAPRTRDFVLCGPPLPDHALEPRDPEGRPLPDRRVGRIFARGPSLMRGYDGQPAETEAVLSADGWLDTGDLGYRLDGQLVVTGRAKDLVIVNGRNVWPQDLEWTVEHALRGARGAVAAFSVDDALLADSPGAPSGGESLVVLVEARTSEPDARERLRDDALAALRQAHGLEARIRLVPPGALPHTSSGKLSRARSRALYLAGAFDQATQDA